MTSTHGNPPPGADDPTTLAALDQALDHLAGIPSSGDPGSVGASGDPRLAGGAGSDRLVGGPGVPPAGSDETADLAALAAELRASVPPPPPGAAERGRTAFLAQAAELRAAGPDRAGLAGQGRRRRAGRRLTGGRAWRRSTPLRVAVLAAVLVLVAVPAAAARQARPGTALWPLRQAGQQVRLNLADDPVHRAHLRLNTAGSYLAAGAGAGEERREEMADRAEDQIRAALDTLDDVSGPQAAAERARAERLLLEVDALERQKDPDDRSGSGSGSGSEPEDDRSGRGCGDDRSGDDRSGRGGDDSGSGSGSSGSGSSGSGRSGSADD